MGEMAPAFQFYARDFIMSCHGMTDEQVGAYTRLLCFAWDREGLPANDSEIQALGYWSDEAWSRIWPVVGQKWKRRGSRLVNERQERERAAQRTRREAAAKAGKLGGQTRAAHRDSKRPLSDRLADTQATDPLESNTASASAFASALDQNQERTAAVEPPIVARSKIILTFPTDGEPGAWMLLESQVSEWAALFPTLDVLGECRSALAWVQADTKRKKTAGGMRRFLAGWLTRSKDRQPGPSKTGPRLVDASAPAYYDKIPAQPERTDIVTPEQLAELTAALGRVVAK
jgi:uncharacterized protein YdaU (DUF1376 family)